MKTKKIIALLLAMTMILGLVAGCGSKQEEPAPATTPTPAATTPEPAPVEEPKTLVVGYSPFNSKFSPFFSETAYDQDVYAMTQVSLLNGDRTGAVITKGINGETVNYNGTDYTYYSIADLDMTENADGTVYYDFTLRDDIVFSDGEKLTVDDAIFTMYVYSDPTYDGSTTFWALPIEGMEEYRAGVETLLNLIYNAGRDNTDFTYFTEDEQKSFWEKYDACATALAQEIVDYCVAAGYNTADQPIGTITATWGFGADDDATLLDVFNIMVENYGGDLVALSDTESAGSSLFDLMNDYNAYTVAVSTGESAPNISGIEKTGDYSLKITMNKFDAVAIYQVGVTVAPLHYYGDASLYDYANNSFGFKKGDLSIVKDKTTKPLGAGPYKFVSYENGVVSFEANENYWKGEPKIKHLQLKETPASDKITGVASGTFDVTDPTMNLAALDSIKSYNSNGEIIGDVIETNLVDNLGYGYLGIAASNVKVGSDKASAESKALRKAFATLFAAYRDTVINSYYGEMATVIQYPISNTSWAAPKPADEGYRLAYSVDADGKDIYTSDMNDEQKADAALQAAVSFLKKAGYTWDDASGKFTAAPAGAEMTYEVIIPADGVGDHPAYGILTATKEALATVGITLEINDPSDSNILWDALDADTADMWAAAWGASVDPDMYQVYHSSNYNAGSKSNHYSITSDKLDELILAARKSVDQSYRKATYKQCLEEILDWAVEVPTYQRQNAILFSPERVNMDTVTPDITTFWKWMNDIELLEMK